MFDNGNPADRRALVQKLNSLGLESSEMEVDGESRVVLALLDMQTDPPVVAPLNPELSTYLQSAGETWDHPAFLYIVTRKKQGQTQVGVLGLNGETGEKFVSDEWLPVNSIEEAADTFQNLWDQRDAFLGNFTGYVSQTGA